MDVRQFSRGRTGGNRLTPYNLVLLPAGSYRRGADDDDPLALPRARPRHLVTLTRPFWIGRGPVTQLEWTRVMGTNPSRFPVATHPVERVSWDEVAVFFERTGLRLPTEAEWEYACRAGSDADRYGPLDEIAWHKANAQGRTHPVGARRPNAWGLHDTLGNVWEWCADYYDASAYSDAPADGLVDPRGPVVGRTRVARGGSVSNTEARVRAAYRLFLAPDNRGPNLGFRVARDDP